MDAEKLAEIERKLDEACEWAVANGWTLTQGFYGYTGPRTCCALGALLVANGHDLEDSGLPRTVQTILDTENDHEIARGFDGDTPEGSEDEELAAHAIGARLRAKYIVTP